MLKVSATILGGRNVMIIGLSDGDIANLVQLGPHAFPGEQIGFQNMDVIIAYGETEEVILEQMKRDGILPQSAQPEKLD